MKKSLLFLGAILSATVGPISARLEASVSSFDSLSYDSESRLQNQWILYTPTCDRFIKTSYDLMNSPLISVAEIGLELARSFVSKTNIAVEMNDCFAARLVKGTAKDLITTLLVGETFNGLEGMPEWIQQVLGVEIGWVSYWRRDCAVHWIDHKGQRRTIATLFPGEKNTFWTRSFLGHIFEIVDSISNEVIGSYVAEYDSFHEVGEHKQSSLDYADPVKQIQRELTSVYFEPKQVKRTFSELGFKVGRLPPAVWSSISAYYYNNREHFTFEEQVGASVFINWWESPCYFLGMPWGLKNRWQQSLLLLVQNWVGHQTPLEQTDIYGIRKYTEGARLLSHVDRITTHAVSLIINVAQFGVREPWMVEIYDFAGRLHEIEMQPGDIVYYEVRYLLIAFLQE